MEFNDEFAAPADYARLYREKGWTVVPALLPGEGKQGQWKRPAVGWKQYQDGVPEDVWDNWYGENGQYIARPNLGILTGKRLFVLDLDLYKTPAAGQWWQAVLGLHNNGIEIETVTQRTGGGGIQMVFRAPLGWTPPTFRSAIGIDVRGMGGFAMLPPSRHESGSQYEWQEGLSPADIDPVEAPAWLCAEIDKVLEQSGGSPQHDGAIATVKTPTPVTDINPLTQRAQDGRETIMYRHAWGWLVNMYRGCSIKPTLAEINEEVAQAYRAYSRKVSPRSAHGGGLSTDEALEREGRGITAYGLKFLRAFEDWDTKIAKHAELPPPQRETERERERVRVTGEIRIDPETGEILEPNAGTSPKPQAQPEAQKTGLEGEFSQPEEASPLIDFPEYSWPDEADIPQREFVYGNHYIRKFVSTDISPGGVGKSSLVMAEALAMATGRPLLGIQPPAPVTVAYWNGEDPLDELQRRSQGILRHYMIDRAQVDSRYRIASGRMMPIVLVTESRGDLVIATPMVEAMVKTIMARKIDVLIIDPFVSSHRVSENDNNSIERVVKLWAQIADVTNCSINLVHHSRKTNGAEVTVEDGRGAVALLAAARSARALNQMSETEAGNYGIENRRFYFRVDNGKSNLTPPPDGAEWYMLKSVTLHNGPFRAEGDKVGVVTRFELPNPMAGMTADHLKIVQNVVASGEWRKDVQSPQWVGYAVAKALNLNMESKQVRQSVKNMVKTWLLSGALETVSKLDPQRRERLFVVVGRWVGETD